MPVFTFSFDITGQIKIEAEDVADAKEKLAAQNLSKEEIAEHGELNLDEEPTLEVLE